MRYLCALGAALALFLVTGAVAGQEKPARTPAVFGIVAGGSDEFVVLNGAYVPGKGWRAPEVARLFAAKGMRFTRFSPAGPVGGPVVASGKPEFGEASEWAMPLVKSASAALPLQENNAPPLFALSGGPSAPQPRRAKRESTEATTYRSAVAGVLREMGRVSVAAPRLTQNLRIDLDGDGTEEVLLTAYSTPQGDGATLPPGGYSTILLRHIGADGRVRTVPLGVSTARIPDKYDLTPAVLACVDIDGDGRLEVVTYATQYESERVEIWTFDGRTARRVIEAGWGV